MKQLRLNHLGLSSNLRVYASDFGVVGNGITDNTASIQAAADEARASRGTLFFDVPDVSYKVDSTVYLAGDSSLFESISVEGEGKSYAADSDQLVKVLFDHSDNVDGPCFALDRVRTAKLDGLAFIGPNLAPESITSFPVETGWVTAGVRDTQYSPQCAIAIDCLVGNTPSDGGFPGRSYLNGSGGSHDIELKNIRIEKSNVGILMGSVVEATNGDVVTLDNTSIVNCQFCVSYGQSQNRANRIVGGDFSRCRAIFTGLRHGLKVGSMPFISQSQVGFAGRIFEFNSSRGPGNIEVYAESISSIGVWGTGVSSERYPLFIKGSYKFQSSGNFLKRPPILQTFGPTIFQSSIIKDNDAAPYAFNIIANGVPVSFGDVVFEVASDSRTQLFQAALGSRPLLSFNGCQVVSGSQVTSLDDNVAYDVIPSRIELKSGTSIVVSDMTNRYKIIPSATNTTVSLGTVSSIAFNATDVVITTSSLISHLMVGDIIGSYLKPLDPAVTGISAPSLRVTDITGLVITCDYMADPSLIDQVTTAAQLSSHVRLYYSFWASLSYTGDTTNTNATLTNLSKANVLRVGDWVKGTGIPSNSRILSVTSNTATMSNNATASGTGIDIYDCQFTAI